MKSIFMSARRNLLIAVPSIRCHANLSGSATHIRTNRNSKEACSQDVASKRLTSAEPASCEASIRVAPRLKKPINPPANSENVANRRWMVRGRIAGVHRTFPIIRAYRNESATGTQLFVKTSSVTATPPKALAACTGAMARVLNRNAMNSRNVGKNATANAPAEEPRANANSVAPNALSMNLMGEALAIPALYDQGV